MLHKNFLRVFLGLSLILVSCYASAKDINVVVQLLKIEALKTSERFGDELYFSMTAYPNKGEPVISRVPMFPMHWLSKELPLLEPTILWQGTIAKDQSVLLILSLLEQDLPPWDTDDHLGSVQVKLANKNGKLVTQWGQPKFSDQPMVEQPDIKVPKFVMLGDHSKYVTVFKVDTAK